MRLLNRKVASFSLVEMLVVLVLSGILLGIVYYAYYNVTRYEFSFAGRIEKVSDVRGMIFSLKKDFDRSEYVRSMGPSELLCSVRGGQPIRYSFSPTYCVRNQLTRSDTFRCALRHTFLWNGKPPDLGQTENIDRVNIVVYDFDPEVRVTIYKSYDAASLIEMTLTDSLP